MAYGQVSTRLPQRSCTPTSADVAQSPLQQKLDGRYWRMFIILALTYTLDYFDFFIISFLMAEVAPDWRLTYGEMGTILISGGVGSIIGSLIGGRLSDRYGRRPLLIWSNAICGVSSGLIAFVPAGSWQLFALLRLVAGLALGAIAAVALAYIVERTPGRHRKMITGLNMVAPSIGIGLASLVAGVLLGHLGWRGLAATGAAPLITSLLMLAFVEESLPWRRATGKVPTAAGQARDATKVSAEYLYRDRSSAPQGETFSDQRVHFARAKPIWLALLVGVGGATGVYGSYLWGPSILAMARSITTAQAARLFVVTSMAGISGKVVFSVLPQYVGRRRAGLASLAAGALSLGTVALMPRGELWGFPMLMLSFLGMSFFLEGGYSNLLPFCTEVFPAHAAGGGAGVVQAGVGAAKILGPLSLTVIAGSGDIIKPAATIHAVAPAFMFLSVCAWIAFGGVMLIRIPERG